MNIIQIQTTNHFPGRYGYSPLAIVLHRSEGSRESVIQWFQNPNSQSSSHYLVCKNGDIIQFVDEKNGAYTNGPYNIPNLQNPLISKYYNQGINGNYWTITIEHELLSGEKMNDIQWKSSIELVQDISRRNNILKDRYHILGHFEFDSVNRKYCPGLSSTEWTKYMNDLNSPGGDIYVPQTGFWIDHRIYPFYVNKGGVQTSGYPLEGSHMDTDGVLRQIFENVMIEYYPTSLTRFGGLGQRYMKLLKG